MRRRCLRVGQQRCSRCRYRDAGCTTRAEDSPYFGKTVPPKGRSCVTFPDPSPSRSILRCRQASRKRGCTSGLYDGLTEYHPETGQPIPGAGRAVGAEQRQLGVHVPSPRSEMVERRSDYRARLRLFAAPRPRAGVRVAHRVPRLLRQGRAGLQRRERAGGRRRRRGRRRSHGAVPLTQPVPFLPGLVAHQFFRPGARGRPSKKYGQAWTQPAEHRHERRVHAEDVEAVRPARRRPRIRSTGTRRTSGSSRSRSTRSKTRRR